MRTITRRSNPVNSSSDDRRDLTVANARLHMLREQVRQKRSGETSNVSENSAETDAQQPVSLPTHLGWGSVRVPIISDSTQPEESTKPSIQLEIMPDVSEIEPQQIAVEPSQTIAVHPSLLIAFLKNEVAAIGRIWLLCRHLDKQGRGWLSVDELRSQLTDKNSPNYVCGWRRLRQILNDGKGVFWQRDPSTSQRTSSDRLWLFSAVKVAVNLNLDHFSGDAIQLPISDLLGSIGAVRTAFYTAFHCGRDSTPISRATLETVTGVPERTQRHYDDASATERVTNLSLIAPAGDEETHWQHGRAAFTFIDKQGKHGAVNQSYTAIRLPNSYNSTRFASLKRKRKRLNKRLKQILVHRGTQGNGGGQVQRLFFTDGKQAARVFGRNNDTYLRDKRSGSTVFWTGWLQ